MGQYIAVEVYRSHKAIENTETKSLVSRTMPLNAFSTNEFIYTNVLNNFKDSI